MECGDTTHAVSGALHLRLRCGVLGVCACVRRHHFICAMRFVINGAEWKQHGVKGILVKGSDLQLRLNPNEHSKTGFESSVLLEHEGSTLYCGNLKEQDNVYVQKLLQTMQIVSFQCIEVKSRSMDSYYVGDIRFKPF